MSLLLTLRAEFAKVADPHQALAMQKYMKSVLPFHGVQTPLRRKIVRQVLKDHPVENAAVWRNDLLAIWRGARFREERYAALDFAEDRRARSFHNMKALKMYEEIIVDGAWWDLVDGVSHQLGEILRNEPAAMKAKMLAWSKSPNIWKRRSSIICQLAFKQDTDLDLLYRCIEPSLGSSEFFLQKGIGWALRQYAWTDPREIKRYVRANKKRLSPLSRREALKNL